MAAPPTPPPSRPTHRSSTAGAAPRMPSHSCTRCGSGTLTCSCVSTCVPRYPPSTASNSPVHLKQPPSSSDTRPERTVRLRILGRTRTSQQQHARQHLLPPSRPSPFAPAPRPRTLAPSSSLHGTARGGLESGVRTAVAALVREIQLSEEYRVNRSSPRAATPSVDAPHHRRRAQEITASHLHAVAASTPPPAAPTRSAPAPLASPRARTRTYSAPARCPSSHSSPRTIPSPRAASLHCGGV